MENDKLQPDPKPEATPESELNGGADSSESPATEEYTNETPEEAPSPDDISENHQYDPNQGHNNQEQGYNPNQGYSNQNQGYNPNQGYNNQNYYNQGYRPQHIENNGFAVAALVMGIMSLLFACCTGIGGVFFGALGIVFAILSKKDEPMATNAKVGLGLSIGGIILGIIIFVSALLYITRGEFQNDLNHYGIENHQSGPDSDFNFKYDFDDDSIL